MNQRQQDAALRQAASDLTTLAPPDNVYHLVDPTTLEESDVEMPPLTQEGIADPAPKPISFRVTAPWLFVVAARVVQIRDEIRQDADGDDYSIRYVTLESCRGDGTASLYPTTMTVGIAVDEFPFVAKDLSKGSLVYLPVLPQAAEVVLDGEQDV